MKIGMNCFSDVEIRSIIETSGKTGRCDITGEVGIPVFDTKRDTSDLAEYLSEIIDVYTPESELTHFPAGQMKKIEDVLSSDWSLFSVNPLKIKAIVRELCKEFYPTSSKVFSEKVGLEVRSNGEYLEKYCLTKQSTWEEFVSSLKSFNRFHSSIINLKELGRIFENPNFQYTVLKGENEFFRGRISEQRLKKTEMGAPPLNLSSAGRANAEGISCLYLAGDETTTLHEIRARDLDIISLGQFEAKRELKLIDLAQLDRISPFRVSDTFTFEWMALNMSILKKISGEIAKPLRRRDSVIDYLPSQYITDYIKCLGYDGVRYRSTLYTEGVNYAIFDGTSFECKKVKQIHVTGLVYNTEDI